MFPIQSRRRLLYLSALVLTAAATVILASPGPAAPETGKKPPAAEAKPALKPARPLTEDEKIVHALNRLAFGPRPGDVERVKAMGLSRYLDQQLHPERVDDS